MSTPFAFDSELKAKLALESEGKRLKEIAVKQWRKYLNSYSPKMYVRTGKSERSIKLGNVVKLDENTLGIELTFVNDLAYHDSIFGGKKGHAIMLISAGWHSKKAEQNMGRGGIYRLTYYEGSGYLYQVYKEFYASRKKGIDIEIQWSGKVQK